MQDPNSDYTRMHARTHTVYKQSDELTCFLTHHIAVAGLDPWHPRSRFQGTRGASWDQVIHGHLPFSVLRDPAGYRLTAAHAQWRTATVVWACDGNWQVMMKTRTMTLWHGWRWCSDTDDNGAVTQITMTEASRDSLVKCGCTVMGYTKHVVISNCTFGGCYEATFTSFTPARQIHSMCW